MSRSVFQLLVLIFLSFFKIDFAFSGDMDTVYKARLKGWEGIVFNCYESSKIKIAICNTIQTDAEFLATAAGIKLVTEKEYSKTQEWQNKHNYLTLEASVNFMGTLAADNRCRSCAFWVELRAYAYYLFGANLTSPENSPMAFPRGGDYVFWQKPSGIAFSGPLDYGRDPFTKDVEKTLKEFFTLFMKANPK